MTIPHLASLQGGTGGRGLSLPQFTVINWRPFFSNLPPFPLPFAQTNEQVYRGVRVAPDAKKHRGDGGISISAVVIIMTRFTAQTRRAAEGTEMPPSQRRRRRARNCGLDTGSLSLSLFLSEVVIVSSAVPQIKNICAFGLRGPSVAGLCSACSLSFSPLSPGLSSPVEATILRCARPAPLCTFLQRAHASSFQDPCSQEINHTEKGRKDAWRAL